MDSVKSKNVQKSQRIVLCMEALRQAIEQDALNFKKDWQGKQLRVVGLPPPPPIEFFYGRDDYLEQIAKYLTIPSVRIVAIVGQPGMGKTALARKVLRDLERGNFPDIGGIVYLSTRTFGISLERLYFDCAKLLDPEIEKNLIASWLKNGRQNASEKSKTLIHALKKQNKNYIILLDNLEDLLIEGQLSDMELRDFLAVLHQEELDVLPQTDENGRAHLLITSRERVSDPELKPPDYQHVQLDDGLRFDESMRMLRELDPDFQLGLKDASDDQLRQLAGTVLRIPRALELICSIKAHNPHMALDEFRTFIRTLPPSSDEREKQRKIVKELATKNFRDMDDNGRRVVEALAIYGRPVPIVAVDFLLAPFAPSSDVPRLIEKLARVHAISCETEAIKIHGGCVLAGRDLASMESEKAPYCTFAALNPISKETNAAYLPPGCPLVALHPLDQEVVREHIRTDKSLPADYLHALEQRAADYYARMRLNLRWSRISHLDPQLLEFEHRVRGGDYAGALRVLDSIDYSLANQQKYRASLMALGYGNYAIKKRLELIGKLGNVGDEARNLTSLAWVRRRMGQTKEAERDFREAVKVSEQSGDAVARVYALSELGYFLTDNRLQHDEAETLLKLALGLNGKVKDLTVSRYLDSHTKLGLAFVEFQRGHNDESLAYASEAELGFTTVPDDYYNKLARFREIDCLVRQNMIHRKMMNYEKGNQVTASGLELAKKHGLEDWQAELNSQYGFNDRGTGDYESAIIHHDNALKLFKEQRGMKREEAVQCSYLGNLYTDLGQPIEANKHYSTAKDIAQTINCERELSWILSNSGVLLCRQGMYEEALKVQKQALIMISEFDEHGGFKRYKHADSATLRLTDISGTYFAQGRYHDALEYILRALHPPEHLMSLPAAYLKTKYVEDQLPHEMQSPGDHQRRGALLAQIYLHTGKLEEARQVIEAARRYDVIAHRGYTAALQGLICARLASPDDAHKLFTNALEYSEEMITKAKGFYEAYYARGLAYAGLGIVHPDKRRAHLLEAEKAYRLALRACDEKGVVEDSARLLNELRLLEIENPLRWLTELVK